MLIYLDYEGIQDDAAQASDSIDISMEEFMRQQVPQIFTRRLEAEVDYMGMENTGLLDSPGRLRQAFIDRMASFITEAQGAAVEAYQQRTMVNSLQSNQLLTPAASSSSLGSNPAPSQETSRISDASQDGESERTREQIAISSSPPKTNAQSTTQTSNTRAESGQAYQKIQKIWAEDTRNHADLNASIFPMPANQEDGSYNSAQETNTEQNWLATPPSSEEQQYFSGSAFDPEWGVPVEGWDYYLHNQPMAE